LTFEYLDHTADAAVRLRCADAADLFRDATLAVLGIFLDSQESRPVEPVIADPVDLESEDGEALLVDYLNELIFRFDTRRLLPASLVVTEVSLGKPSRLKGEVRGEIMDPRKHLLKTEIKAATFHGLQIRELPSGLEAEVVFDL
jgi:SHS2 domain-containing protein